MKQSDGFTKLRSDCRPLVAMIASFALLALAMRSLPLSTAYPIWTGIGAAWRVRGRRTLLTSRCTRCAPALPR